MYTFGVHVTLMSSGGSSYIGSFLPFREFCDQKVGLGHLQEHHDPETAFSVCVGGSLAGQV